MALVLVDRPLRAACVFSRLQTPIYQASTTILVNEANSAQANNYSAIYLTYSQLTNTYAAMLTKQPLLDKVKQRLGLADTSAQFSVKVNPVRDTQLLQLVVESTDPYLAASVANELVLVFTDEIKSLQESKFLSSKENLQNQLTYLEKQIQDNSTSLDALIQANIKTIQQQTQSQQIEPVPTQTLEEQARQMNQPEINQIETRLTQYRQIYASVLASFEQIRLAEAQATTSFIQVEPAVPSTAAIRPQVLRNTLLAVIVGLMLAVGGIFAIEFLDDTGSRADWFTRPGYHQPPRPTRQRTHHPKQPAFTHLRIIPLTTHQCQVCQCRPSHSQTADHQPDPRGRENDSLFQPRRRPRPGWFLGGVDRR
ncbi:MAG TPA: hypothetical protein PJ988_13155 [Anaerolinea sp.]|nr:hypothetical protein [Anaerolinea sp.]